MGSLNRVFLMGNLTRDPQVRKTPAGSTVSDMGVAVSDSYTNKSGERVETTCFADVVVWGKQAETCGQYLSKGSAVVVEGRLEYDQWETQEGEKRSRLRVRADRVQFVGRLSKAGPADAGGRKAPATAESGVASEGEMPF